MQTTHQKLMSQKNTDMNMEEVACFLSLLMRSHNACYQENKYMEIYRTILHSNIILLCNIVLYILRNNFKKCYNVIIL